MIEEIKQKYKKLDDKKSFKLFISDVLGKKYNTIHLNWFTGDFSKVPEDLRTRINTELDKQLELDEKINEIRLKRYVRV
jgi:hypothetical protein